MNQPERSRAWRLPAIALVCIMLGACSTTQKSSTVTGSVEDEQVAAPVTEAGAAPAESGASAPSSATSAPSSTQAADQSLPEFPPTPIDSQDQVEARQQLAEQEAEITRLREEQAQARQAAEEEAARLEQLDASGTAQSQSSGAAPSAGTASSATSPATGATGSAAGGADPQAVDRPLETSVYFEFDRASVSTEYDAVVAANAAFLKANPNLKVTIQGNCDERGSREYNLALGQRRAEMVKRALELSGVDGRRIDTVSFGSEKPVAFGKDEESYRQNRRADIIY